MQRFPTGKLRDKQPRIVRRVTKAIVSRDNEAEEEQSRVTIDGEDVAVETIGPDED